MVLPTVSMLTFTAPNSTPKSSTLPLNQNKYKNYLLRLRKNLTNIRSIAFLIFLLAGLTVSLVLVRQQQNIQVRAEGLVPPNSVENLKQYRIARYLYKSFNSTYTNGSKEDIDAILRDSTADYNVISWLNTDLLYVNLTNPDPSLGGLKILENTINYLANAQENGVKSVKSLLIIDPRFSPDDGLSDRLSDGTIMQSNGNVFPNYAIIDIFDPVQRQTYYDYIGKVAKYFANNANVVGFNVNWGIGSENAFLVGINDSYGSDNYVLNKAAGYSVNALTQFKEWMQSQGFTDADNIDADNPATWPIPDPTKDPQPFVYIKWMQFRDQAAQSFQEGMIDAAKAYTSKPVGTFDYLMPHPFNVSKSLSLTQNTDFNLNQFGIGTEFYSKTLLDTDFIYPAIGLEPPNYDSNNPKSSITWPWYQIQMIREIVKGAYPMVFYRPEYVQSGLAASAGSFIKNQLTQFSNSIVKTPTEVALFIPTWSYAAYKPDSAYIFKPQNASNLDSWDTTYYINLLESIGVNYDLVREEDLLDPAIYTNYKAVIVPGANYLRYGLTSSQYESLTNPQTILLDFGNRLNATNLRTALKTKAVANIPIITPLFHGDRRAVVGMNNNVVYNFSGSTQNIVLCFNNQQNVTLPAYGYQILQQTQAKSKIGFFSPTNNAFELASANCNLADLSKFNSGISATQPITGDWNGDGKTKVGLFNPQNGVFYLYSANATGKADLQFRYGPAGLGWLPIAGDWNGDGKTTIGLYDAKTGIFYLRNTNSAGNADLQFRYGPANSTWLPIAGDWDGDGKTTIGLYNPQNSVFYLRNTNSAGNADLQFQYGPAGLGWLPIVGDWDGDGKTTVGLYNPSASVFYLRNSNSGGVADMTITLKSSLVSPSPITGNW